MQTVEHFKKQTRKRTAVLNSEIDQQNVRRFVIIGKMLIATIHQPLAFQAFLGEHESDSRIA